MNKREHIESLSIENARCFMRAMCADYNEVTGEGLSIAENVSSAIDSTLLADLDQERDSVY